MHRDPYLTESMIVYLFQTDKRKAMDLYDKDAASGDVLPVVVIGELSA